MSLKKHELMIRRMMQAFIELANKTDNQEIAEKLFEDMSTIDIRCAFVDGRSNAWDDKRRKEFGEKISANWEKKKAEGLAPRPKKEEPVYYLWTYRDQEPELIGTIQDVANHCKASLRTLKNRMEESRDGIIVQRKNLTSIYALNAEAMDRLRHVQASITGDVEDIITLPSKNGSRSF